MIALLEAHRTGLLRREHWLRNVVAGLVVGVVALPLAMAEHGIEGLQIATVLAGVMLILFGVARLGAIIKFIPDRTHRHQRTQRCDQSDSRYRSRGHVDHHARARRAPS